MNIFYSALILVILVQTITFATGAKKDDDRGGRKAKRNANDGIPKGSQSKIPKTAVNREDHKSVLLEVQMLDMNELSNREFDELISGTFEESLVVVFFYEDLSKLEGLKEAHLIDQIENRSLFAHWLRCQLEPEENCKFVYEPDIVFLYIDKLFAYRISRLATTYRTADDSRKAKLDFLLYESLKITVRALRNLTPYRRSLLLHYNEAIITTLSEQVLSGEVNTLLSELKQGQTPIGICNTATTDFDDFATLVKCNQVVKGDTIDVNESLKDGVVKCVAILLNSNINIRNDRAQRLRFRFLIKSLAWIGSHFVERRGSTTLTLEKDQLYKIIDNGFKRIDKLFCVFNNMTNHLKEELLMKHLKESLGVFYRAFKSLDNASKNAIYIDHQYTFINLQKCTELSINVVPNLIDELNDLSNTIGEDIDKTMTVIFNSISELSRTPVSDNIPEELLYNLFRIVIVSTKVPLKVMRMHMAKHQVVVQNAKEYLVATPWHDRLLLVPILLAIENAQYLPVTGYLPNNYLRHFSNVCGLLGFTRVYKDILAPQIIPMHLLLPDEIGGFNSDFYPQMYNQLSRAKVYKNLNAHLRGLRGLLLRPIFANFVNAYIKAAYCDKEQRDLFLQEYKDTAMFLQLLEVRIFSTDNLSLITRLTTSTSENNITYFLGIGFNRIDSIMATLLTKVNQAEEIIVLVTCLKEAIDIFVPVLNQMDNDRKNSFILANPYTFFVYKELATYYQDQADEALLMVQSLKCAVLNTIGKEIEDMYTQLHSIDTRDKASYEWKPAYNKILSMALILIQVPLDDMKQFAITYSEAIDIVIGPILSLIGEPDVTEIDYFTKKDLHNIFLAIWKAALQDNSSSSSTSSCSSTNVNIAEVKGIPTVASALSDTISTRIQEYYNKHHFGDVTKIIPMPKVITDIFIDKNPSPVVAEAPAMTDV